MIAAFLLPFPVRGYRAPFLWVFYKLLASYKEPMHFICGRDYVVDADVWRQAGRWEMLDISCQRLEYSVPSSEHIGNHSFHFLENRLFERLLADAGGNPLALYAQLLSRRIPMLEEALAEALSDMPHNSVEAILTWCNCPSLKTVSEAMSIPVVHLEMGPLRWPDYRSTAYFDFRGVNGFTEAHIRYESTDWQGSTQLQRGNLRRFFLRSPCPRMMADHAVGLALQVEDDSNLMAFGSGYDNQALIVKAHLDNPAGNVIVRGHPGSLFRPRQDWYEVDDSVNSIEFISRIERLMTINSSVGLEAILFGKPVEVLGDCAYRFIVDIDDESEVVRRLAHYLFAYLVPMPLIFEPDYLRFRLSRPTDTSVVSRHIDCYAPSGNLDSSLDGLL